MDKYVAKYFVPILGQTKAEAIEALAKIVQSGHFNGCIDDCVRDIMGGRLNAIDVQKFKQRKKREISQETKNKRYLEQLQKLKEKYSID